MKITGENRIAASRETVWEALNDADILRQAIPGCTSLEKLSDTEFKAVVTTKIGPIKAKFNGDVTLSDLDPPNGYTVSGKGSGGAAGSAKGSARVTLTTDGADATRLAYEVDAQVTGKLAQLGSRLIDSTAKALAAKFFTALQQIVGGEVPTEPDAKPRMAVTAGLPVWVWGAGAALLIALALYGLFG